MPGDRQPEPVEHGWVGWGIRCVGWTRRGAGVRGLCKIRTDPCERSERAPEGRREPRSGDPREPGERKGTRSSGGGQQAAKRAAASPAGERRVYAPARAGREFEATAATPTTPRGRGRAGSGGSSHRRSPPGERVASTDASSPPRRQGWPKRGRRTAARTPPEPAGEQDASDRADARRPPELGRPGTTVPEGARQGCRV